MSTPKRISERQAMDVKHTINEELSWGLFKEYIISQAKEKRIQSRVLGGDLTKLLEREQVLGQADLLDSLLEDFHNHVVHVATIHKSEAGEQEHA